MGMDIFNNAVLTIKLTKLEREVTQVVNEVKLKLVDLEQKISKFQDRLNQCFPDEEDAL